MIIKFRHTKISYIQLISIVLCFSSASSLALIMVHDGNDPVPNMGWPTGTEKVANLPSRLGYQEGPPFGGGEYYFDYRCKNTVDFNDALQK